MKNHAGDIPGFHWSSRAWYWNAPHETGERIQIGFYAEEGGTSGEFHIHWVQLGHRKVPQLCVFDDAWNALQELPGLINALAQLDTEGDSESITPAEFVEVLKKLGYKDLTQYERPKHDNW